MDAPSNHTWSLATGSRVRLDGSSTLHRYQAESKKLSATVTVAPDAQADDGASLLATARAGNLAGVTFQLPVKTLSSGESGLDKNMWKALKADTAPTIAFRLTSSRGPDAGALQVSGRLSVAGVEKAVDVPVKAVLVGGDVNLTGTFELKMSDFGVQPPVLLAGTIKTADAIKVTFELVLHRS
jgi:hypothetical protein